MHKNKFLSYGFYHFDAWIDCLIWKIHCCISFGIVFRHSIIPVSYTHLCNSSVRRILDSFSDDPDYQNAFMEPARAKDAVTGKTLVVVVDIHKPTMVECPEIIKFAPRVVLIDHHRRSTEYILSLIHI